MKNLYIIFAALVIFFSTNTVSAKTFEIVKSGKYTDAAIWKDNNYPGTQLSNTDLIIVNNHIVLNSDLQIEGTFIVEKNFTLISNKTIVVTNQGKIINSGTINVKSLINEGSIDNYSQLETTADLQNRGTINNNVNMVMGTNFINQNSKVKGENGTYFVNGTNVSSPSTEYSKNIKLFVAENNNTQTASNMTLDATVVEKNVILSVNNPKAESVSAFEIERSFDGKNFDKISEVKAENNNTSIVLFQDVNVQNDVVHYKVKAINNTEVAYLPLATVKVANENKASIK